MMRWETKKSPVAYTELLKWFPWEFSQSFTRFRTNKSVQDTTWFSKSARETVKFVRKTLTGSILWAYTSVSIVVCTLLGDNIGIVAIFISGPFYAWRCKQYFDLKVKLFLKKLYQVRSVKCEITPAFHHVSMRDSYIDAAMKAIDGGIIPTTNSKDPQ
jgi:hypothetical protein